MGWLWGDSSKDPVKELDPSLRKYLEQESSDKHVPAHEVKQPSPAPSTPPQESEDSSKPKVPAASLYQDGRYAHLWKTYKPPVDATDESSGVRGAERVIEKFKERGDTVQRAAMENCALENEALALCFKTGSWRKQIESRLTACSAENRTFSRCFATQSKFLQALGYAASFDEDPEREERIQLHADKLYHQMLDYEKKVEEAKAAGEQPPPIRSLFHPESPPQPEVPAAEKKPYSPVEIPGGEAIPDGFKPSKPLHQLTPHERELEIRLHNSQIEQHKLYAQEASPFMKGHDEAKEKRRAKAVSWFGETIGNWIA